MLAQLKSLLESYKQYNIDHKKKTSLDLLLESANARDPLESRLLWIQKLFAWARPDSTQFENKVDATYQLKFLLAYLEEKPRYYFEVQKVFHQTLSELSCLDFFCEIGLPGQLSFFGEINDKLMSKVLPDKPFSHQLGEFMLSLFPNKDNGAWIKNIDPMTLEHLFLLFLGHNELKYPNIERDIEEALIYLVSQITAIGLSPLIKNRLPASELKALPFFKLSSKLNLYLKLKKPSPEFKLKEHLYKELQQLLLDCELCLKQVYQHMDHFGVSVHLVYQLERLKSYIGRAKNLLILHFEREPDKKMIAGFVAELINQSQRKRSLRALLAENVTLLTQKIVDYNSQKGEHYIASDYSGFSRMFNRAMGGGFVTAFTIYIKIFISSLSLTGLINAMMSSLNYAGSFLLIHFAGFTLATKQPASTAPALAQKLESLDRIEEINLVTEEIIMVARTQFVAVLGNILTVIPCVLFIHLLFHALTGNWSLDYKAAEHLLHSTDLFGPAIFYAGFTGLLLWFSGVCAGWAENWFSYNNLFYIISNNLKYKTILGVNGSLKLARLLEKNISGIAGSLSLGILLGLSPEVLKFLNIPIEVRHITLSTGALFAALPVLGSKIIKTFFFWRCLMGLFFIGITNITVSFAMAFFVAVRAKKIPSQKRKLIYRSVLNRFLKNPLDFIFYRERH